MVSFERTLVCWGFVLMPAMDGFLFPGPEFHYTWLPGEKAFEVSVPEGPAVMVRLCHQLALECEELHQPFHKQVGTVKCLISDARIT